MRKKEREMEKKLKEQEAAVVESKKGYARVQELNSKLMTRVKELEEENEILKNKEDLAPKVKKLEGEKKR